jgi:uncharacterized alkaline shock family protein YloU
VGDVVRRAALGSYGVVSVSGPWPWHTVLAWIGRGTPGVRVRLGPPLTIDLYLAVARGVPVAEVARNVEAAVRYGVGRALGREIDALAIHIDRLRAPGGRPAADPDPLVGPQDPGAPVTTPPEASAAHGAPEPPPPDPGPSDGDARPGTA